eukprot:COSAG02_NODE_406_length_22916_cov_35.137529_9_plen_103_part_00
MNAPLECLGDDKTRITMPIEPAIQVPNTAKPTCYLHNMAFTNSIANVNAADESNRIVWVYDRVVVATTKCGGACDAILQKGLSREAVRSSARRDAHSRSAIR